MLDITPSIDMFSNDDPFKSMFGNLVSYQQPTKEIIEKMDSDATWDTFFKWMAIKGQAASANLERLATTQNKLVVDEKANLKGEFLESLFLEFDSFARFICKGAVYLRNIDDLMTATIVSLTCKQAAECMQPYLSGGNVTPVLTLWTVVLMPGNKCVPVRKSQTKPFRVFGMKLIHPNYNIESMMQYVAPDRWCFLAKEKS